MFPNFEDKTEESYFCELAVPMVEENFKAGDKRSLLDVKLTKLLSKMNPGRADNVPSTF